MLLEKFFSIVKTLSSACSNKKTAASFILILMAMCLLPDELGGVTILFRSLSLDNSSYHKMLRFFKSKAFCLDTLISIWHHWVFCHFKPVMFNDCHVYFLDGHDAPKSGKKIPGVRSLHSASNNNSKKEFFMGHSWQVLTKAVTANGKIFATYITSKISDGIIIGPRQKKTLFDDVKIMIEKISFPPNSLIIADSYYYCRHMMLDLRQRGLTLITRVARNAVAYDMVELKKTEKRGRPPIYGEKIILQDIFYQSDLFSKTTVNLYGKNTEVKIYSKKLWMKTSKMILRYVWVETDRGRIILASTNLSLSPINILRAYSLRFKIEVTFKHMIQNVRSWQYRFWMKDFDETETGDKKKYLHRKAEEYRDKVKDKIRSYMIYVQVSGIVLGIQQYFACAEGGFIIQTKKLFFRTIPKNHVPSEYMVGTCLRSSYWEFLQNRNSCPILKKFLIEEAPVTCLEKIMGYS